MQIQTSPLAAALSMEPSGPRIDWEQYLRIEPLPGLRFEYEEGRLLVSPSGNAEHDLLIAVLLEVFGAYEERTDGRYAVAFPPHSFYMPPGERDYQPDVGIITDARKDGPIAERTIGAPNIAVEILSRSTAHFDRGLKARRYFEQGTSEYWLFDASARTIEVHRRGDAGWVRVEGVEQRYETPLLPDFVLDLNAIWGRLDRKLRRAPR